MSNKAEGAMPRNEINTDTPEDAVTRAMVAETPADQLAEILEETERRGYKPMIREALRNEHTSPEAMQKLFDLQVAYEEREAQAALRTAIARFQSECPPIYRNKKKVGGGGFDFRYADLEQIVTETRSLLAKHGLTVQWDTRVTERDGKPPMIHVTCFVRHVAGAELTSLFECELERLLSRDGKHVRSLAQDMQATRTTAQRHSMCQALALVTSDEVPTEDWSRGGETVSAEQAKALKKLVKDTGTDKEKFLAYANADDFEGIPESRYRILELELKRKLDRQNAPMEPEPVAKAKEKAAVQDKRTQAIVKVVELFERCEIDPMPEASDVQRIADAWIGSGIPASKLRMKIVASEGNMDDLLKRLK